MDEEIEIYFRDVTIQEADGEFDAVDELADPDSCLETWVISSEFGITQGDVGATGVGEFWKNGDFILTMYGTEFQTDYVPVDLIFLNAWLSHKGWKLVIDPFFRDALSDFWDMFDRLIQDDEMLLSDYDDEEDDGEEEDIEIARPQKEMEITDLPQFKNLKSFFEQRAEKEKRIF